MTKIRILVVDDHLIVRQGVRSLLSNYGEFEIIGEAESGEQALAYVKEYSPDIVLLDIRMPGEGGLEVLRNLRREYPHVKVLMLTSYHEDEYIMGALKGEAHGYVLKSVSDETLVQAIHSVIKGEPVISPKIMERLIQHIIGEDKKDQPVKIEEHEDREILRYMAAGDSNLQIASKLYMSETTVKRKLKKIFRKLNVDTRAQAAAEAVRRGLI